MSTLSFSPIVGSVLSADVYTDTKKKQKLTSYEKAVVTYRKAHYKLLNVVNWNRMDNLDNWNYTLIDNAGALKQELCTEGDYIRFTDKTSGIEGLMMIDKILEVAHEDWVSTAIRLRPVKTGNDNTSANATDSITLSVERNHNRVSACIHERNNVLHTRKVEGIYSQIYNAIADLTGRKKGQWESLINSLI